MSFIYTNIVGSFIFDKNLEMEKALLFRNIKEYFEKQQVKDVFKKEYPNLKGLPKDKQILAMTRLRDKKLYNLFKDRNMELTRLELKKSTTTDTLIMQTIASMREIDRIVNIMSKRLREWVELTVPEVSKQIEDHSKLANYIADMNRDELLQVANVKEEESIGSIFEEIDFKEIQFLAEEVSGIFELKASYEKYLEKLMKNYCPNLLEIAGANLGAKLLEVGRSLRRLAFLPGSTVQILGAEKALFRHMKTGAKPPKYGVLYAHPLIQKAKRKEKGKVARALADKIALCVKLDYFNGEFLAKKYVKEIKERFYGKS